MSLCGDASGIFEKELEALHYQQPPYSTTYPQLPNIMNVSAVA